MTRTFLIIGGLAMMTMACTTPSEDGAVGPAPPAAEGSDGHCNAEGLNDLIGRPRSDQLGAEAQRRSGARTLRWINPGDAVTMDFREDRLNITLDAQSRVEGLSCG